MFPGQAFSYISRSFKQTTSYIVGALRLLALSYPPNEINSKGWSLYAGFRPQVDGWGKRSEVKCAAILILRRKETIVSTSGSGSVGETALQPVIKGETISSDWLVVEPEESGEPKAKRERTTAADGSETALETVDNVSSNVEKGDV